MGLAFEMCCAIRWGDVLDLSLYECVGAFWKRTFFGRVLCCRSAWTVVGSGFDEFSTLGDSASWSSFRIICGPFVFFVGGVIGWGYFDCGSIDCIIGSESESIRPSCVASSSSAFLTGSPASRDGDVVDGGYVRRVMISSADWMRKSYNFTWGNGME